MPLAGVSELADEADSKSVDGNIVRVRPPLPALAKPVKSGFFDFEEGYLVCYFYLQKNTQNQIYPFILKFSHICTNIKETIISTIVVMVLAK